MARGRAAPARARGGEVIQAPRPGRARLVTGAAAVAALAAAGGFGVADGGSYASAALGATALGLLFLVVALVLRAGVLVPWAVIATAGGYLAVRAGHDTVDGWAAVVGVLLLLAAELAAWSIDADARIHAERALVVRRVLTLAGLCTAALVANFLLLATTALSATAGALLALLGTTAAVVAVAVVLRLSRRVTA
jgi:hypothetical protein